ncbi:MAG: sulfite exporter TauE/SafE family protein [Acetatifactor sp.]
MAWMMFAAVCAYLIKGLCGFANTLIFSSILSFQFDNVNISPVELLLGYPSNVILAWRERKAVRLRVCLPLALLVLLGNLPGIFLLKNAGAEWVKFFFGLVIMGLGVEMLIRERTAVKGRQVSKGALAIIGILSGLLCGLYGIGALLAAYMSRVTENSSSFKGNLCVVFLIENTFRIVMYSVTGLLTAEVLQTAVMLVPAMVIGLFLGVQSSRRLREETVRKAVILLLILSGAALVWKQIVA